MSRMIDLIRVSALPSNLMQSASKGSLAVPAAEMIEILVHLALHNRVFGQQAQITLAGWDEAASRTAAGNPSTSKDVLNYLIAPKNLRPVLLPTLLANPSVSGDAILELASAAGREVVEVMLKSERVIQSPAILHALQSNSHLSGIQGETVRHLLNPNAPEPQAAPSAPSEVATNRAASTQEQSSAEKESVPETTGGLDEVFHLSPAGSAEEADEVLDQGVLAYMAEHAGEISAESNQLFQPIGGAYEEFMPTAEEAADDAASPAGAAAGVKKAPSKKTGAGAEERGSALQKISRLDIKGRIQLAMKGTKEERSLLIRDGTKIVALAVLESPKVSDGEVEKFAGQKNVLEAVLRGIPMKRRFAKNYSIIRALVFNPRTPLDLSLSLMKNILVNDLRNLSSNKEVSDTVRKLATKMFKQKMEASSGKK
jgi:hypothetical protein